VVRKDGAGESEAMVKVRFLTHNCLNFFCHPNGSNSGLALKIIELLFINFY
jgi:hypothetical protein